MTRILVVEDEPGIAFALEADLQTEGYAVTVTATGDEALRLALGDSPLPSGEGGGAAQREPDRAKPQEKGRVRAGFDLILLDVMLPGKDGFEVCRALRRSGLQTPIILLTAKAQEAEKVMGLELGADDYVTKPFSPRELRARIKAVLRRFQSDRPGVYRFDNFEIDFDRAELRRGNKTLEATPLEFKLLSVFIQRRGRVLSRQQLIDEAWGRDTFVTDRVVDSHIVNLRRKIEPKPTQPRYLLSVRGIGYRFDG